ncbi:hypothetical protein [Streptomyces koyangensis]
MSPPSPLRPALGATAVTAALAAALAAVPQAAAEDGSEPTTSSTMRPAPSASPSAPDSSGAALPEAPASPLPSHGVQGGIGGGVEQWGTVTTVGGAVLVAAALGGAGWMLRRSAGARD